MAGRVMGGPTPAWVALRGFNLRRYLCVWQGDVPLLAPLPPSAIEFPISRLTLRLAFALVTLTTSACAAVGWTLPNYGFFGFAPQPDARQLAPVTVIEHVKLIVASDTTALHEGEFRIDSTRTGGELVWVISRRTLDAQQRPVADSVWMDGWTLRTLRTASHRADGVLRQRFDRRAVQSEWTLPTGRVKRRKMLYEAEPYGGIGIEVLVATLPLQVAAGGQLPVVDGFDTPMAWLSYEVVAQTQEARSAVGGMVFRPVWLVDIGLRGATQRLWIDGMDRSILRREAVLSPTTRQLVVRGQPVPSLQYFPVEPLTSANVTGARTVRQGRPAQVVPWQPPPPSSGSAPPPGGTDTP